MSLVAVLVSTAVMTAFTSLLQPTVIECDIVVAGGSTASLASAITAAEAAPDLRVCFTEITDWPGGQMSSGGVPAIDFGGINGLAANW
jgi:ribulose 1,5-bisphosphate synthetase/thiazole synthase